MDGLNKEQFMTLCKEIGLSLDLQKKGMHVAGLFEDNNSDNLIGWATLDSENKVIKKYDKIEDLFEEYGKK